jgi:hypothetical protein
MKNFTTIWNEAYEAYDEQGIDGLNIYLENCGLPEADAETLKDDIIETYNL